MSLSRQSRSKTVPSTPTTFKVSDFGTCCFLFGTFILMIFLSWESSFLIFVFACLGGLRGIGFWDFGVRWLLVFGFAGLFWGLVLGFGGW